MQPWRPHGHSAPPSLTTMWPISPAPPRPIHWRPSRMSPPPTPVPQNTPRTESNGRAAPSSNSASVATETSLPRRTSSTPSLVRSRSATGTGLSKPARLPALTTVPLLSSASPGEPTPTPARSRVCTPAFSAASRSASARASTTASAPSVAGVGRRASPTILCCSSATIACTFVPPRSMPPRRLATREGIPDSSAPRSTVSAVFVREFSDGAEVDQVLLVRQAELRRRRDGAEYLCLSLGDRTGAVAAVVWDGVADCTPHARAGAPVRVAGRFAQHPRYGAQITVRALGAAAEGSYVLDELLDGPPHPVDDMEVQLRR